jgi:glycosyltransferase 2 family protein
MASLISRIPTWVRLVAKVLVTVGAFWLLLMHTVDVGDGTRITIWRAIASHVRELEAAVFVPFVMAAAFIKFGGIFASMVRWHLLLIGQGIRFNFSHVVGSFLIGRFLGTFLPSTVGLDGYKLYDAARFSERVIEPAAATAVEKVMGLSGVFMCFLVTFPLGYAVLGRAATAVALVTIPMAALAVAALFALLFWPALMQWGIGRLPAFGRGKITAFSQRLAQAASAYRGKARLLATVIGLSFTVHFTTAAMYFFTALAVGAQGVDFWEVTFASTIQIFATVMSPFTIAGEGVREIVQALLLAKRIGASESVLSAALGFWAAEALTTAGAFFLWVRGPNYRPRLVALATPTPAHDSRAA